MANRITVDYDSTTQIAMLTFMSGRTLRLKTSSRARAKRFARVHGPELEKSDCVVNFIDGKAVLPSGLTLTMPVKH